MLKLKYLFDNRDLAMMLINNWEYDEDSLELFRYFRISSNAIYPFKYKGKLQFLRMTPASEKDRSSISTEVDILSKLESYEYAVPKVIKSKDENFIETKDTPWGIYHALVLEGVGDKSLENLELNLDICYDYGKFLGEFHNISREIESNDISRDTVSSKLESFESLIDRTDDKVIKEFSDVKAQFMQLDNNSNDYGLIHYDFELDNIMHEDKSSKLYAIDFDDAMIGWFGQDIERALRSIKDECEEGSYHEFEESFLNGYKSTGNDISNYLQNKKLYYRFASLYKYLRIKDSLDEKWDNEPLWMDNLRKVLNQRMINYRDGL